MARAIAAHSSALKRSSHHSQNVSRATTSPRRQSRQRAVESRLRYVEPGRSSTVTVQPPLSSDGVLRDRMAYRTLHEAVRAGRELARTWKVEFAVYRRRPATRARHEAFRLWRAALWIRRSSSTEARGAGAATSPSTPGSLCAPSVVPALTSGATTGGSARRGARYPYWIRPRCTYRHAPSPITSLRQGNRRRSPRVSRRRSHRRR